MAQQRIRPNFDDDEPLDPAAAAAMASYRARLLGTQDETMAKLSPSEQGYALEIERLKKALDAAENRIRELEQVMSLRAAVSYEV